MKGRMRTHHSTYDSSKIICMWLLGKSAWDISLETGASLSTVYRWIRRYVREGLFTYCVPGDNYLSTMLYPTSDSASIILVIVGPSFHYWGHWASLLPLKKKKIIPHLWIGKVQGKRKSRMFFHTWRLEDQQLHILHCCITIFHAFSEMM